MQNASSHIEKKLLPVLGMTCAACAVSVESMLQHTPGVQSASVNFANQTATVTYESDKVAPIQLQEVIRGIGYDLVIEEANKEAVQAAAAEAQYRILRKRTIGASLLSVPLVIIGMFFMNMPYANWIMMALATPVVFYFGRSFFIHAYKQASHGKANMDTLVALSTGIAWLFSTFNTLFPSFWHDRGLHAHVYFESAAVIIAFISLGKLLEEKAKSNTSSAIRKLMGLQPQTVMQVQPNGDTLEIPISQVQTGDRLLVKPGDRIPVDGVVSEGSSFVDESMISGEPVAVSKNINDTVFTGTMNQKGSFIITAQKVGSETVLARIIAMVQEAQGSKAPVQRIVDRIAGIFVPVVIGIAILTLIVWSFSGADNAFIYGLLNAVTVLVIACPCALGLATPTAIMVGIGKGAENNMLIRDAEALELAQRIDAVVLDKTGTITEGKPEVTGIHQTVNTTETADLGLLLGIEHKSEHPLAEAITRYLQQKNIQIIHPDSFESITGKGVTAVYQGENYWVGNRLLMSEAGIQIGRDTEQQVAAWEQQARTVIYYAGPNGMIATVAIADQIKQGSAAAIQSLRKSGIEVYMLTGDNKASAAAIARETGISEYKAEVLPADKAAFIQLLQSQGKTVAMVGDGINDSHAMAQADVSMAMGKGSDIAMDVAKITLIGSDLGSIPKVIHLSRHTVKTIRQNLFWAFIYNLIGIPIAAGVLYPSTGFLLDPMIAGAAMALSSVSVVSNSLRLKWKTLHL
jgi:Cu2+-exporting ATPase